MNKLAIFLLFNLMSFGAEALEHYMIDTLGTSPKGQYVAVEEYGYKKQKHIFYVKIKVLNVWTEQYVGNTFEVQKSALEPKALSKLRLEAFLLAQNELALFNIHSKILSKN